MIPNCAGCKEEFDYAIYCQEIEGLFFATSTAREYNGKKHFAIYMIDRFGNIIVE